ncbi:MAG: FkbM family methyltransferase [Chitinivibrionales bacterium]|nr:FkbM family methyltransferase [Chitinivibrionales bacterium]
MSLSAFSNTVATVAFGWEPLQSVWDEVFGYHWRGYSLGLIRYRAQYMVKPGETVFLCGVFNEGYVRNYLETVGESGKIIVVEANTSNANKLKNKFASYRNVIVLNRAIWNKRGTMEFVAGGEDDAQGYNRIEEKSISDFPTKLVKTVVHQKVETSTLDHIAADLNLPIVHQINLTINGAEYCALNGMESLLKINPRLRLYINSQRPDPAYKVVDKLKSMGFKVYDSKLIRTTNKSIKLLRIYACR